MKGRRSVVTLTLPCDTNTQHKGNVNYQQNEYKVQRFLPVHQNDAGAEEDESDSEEKRQRHVIWKPGRLDALTRGCIVPSRTAFVQGNVAIITIIHHCVGEVTLNIKDSFLLLEIFF